MNIENVEKKQREAKFFLNKMSEQERLAFEVRDSFDFYLSAFLSAARTVHWRLCHEQAAIYTEWRKAWDASLTSAERSLIEFMRRDRNIEVHASGSSRSVKTKDVPVRTEPPERAGLMDAMNDVAPFTYAIGTSPTVMHKPSWSLTIEGTERSVVDACVEYLTLLDRMVDQFKADHP
jgi:hypothetical protein